MIYNHRLRPANVRAEIAKLKPKKTPAQINGLFLDINPATSYIPEVAQFIIPPRGVITTKLLACGIVSIAFNIWGSVSSKTCTPASVE